MVDSIKKEPIAFLEKLPSQARKIFFHSITKNIEAQELCSVFQELFKSESKDKLVELIPLVETLKLLNSQGLKEHQFYRNLLEYLDANFLKLIEVPLKRC